MRIDPLRDLGNGANLVRVIEHLRIRVEESGQSLPQRSRMIRHQQVHPSHRTSDHESVAVALELLDDQGVELVAGG
ncbi:hypothetical protein PMAYCL1PPCAC_05283, partial [Pristionchus mayeri]